MSGPSGQMTNRDLLAVLLVILLWGMNFVPTKFALHDFTPFQLGAGRFLLAAFPLILFVPRLKIPFAWLLFYALTQGVGQFGFLFVALNIGMSAAMASVLMQTQIFFTALFGVLLLGEIIPRPLKWGMVVAAAGLICFAWNVISSSVAEAGSVASVSWAGFLLTLLAASMWASSNVVVKKLQVDQIAYTPLSLIAWSSLISGLVFAVIAWVFDDPAVRWHWLNASAVGWVSLLYAGWGAGVVAFWLWTVLLMRYPASRVAPYSLGIPLVGLLAGIFILHEQVTPLQWLGSALVMSALILVVGGSLFSVQRLRRLYKREL